MKLLILCLLIIILSLTQCNIEKQVIYKEVCDSLKLEQQYKSCLNASISDNKKQTIREKNYYKNQCIKEARKLFCPDIKGIEYSKNGKVIDFIPCDSLLRQKDKKLCLE